LTTFCFTENIIQRYIADAIKMDRKAPSAVEAGKNINKTKQK